MRLSATYHPFEYFLKEVPNFISGVESVEACYKKDGQGLYFSLRPSGLSPLEQQKMFEWRKKRANFMWISSPLALLSAQESVKQGRIEDEQSLQTLLIFLKNTEDGLSDLLMITFQDQFSLINADKAFKQLSTTEKQVISHLCVTFIRSEYERIVKEHKLLQSFHRISESQNTTIAHYEDKIKHLEQVYSATVSNYIESIRSELSKAYDCTFLLENDAKSKLIRSQHSLEEIRQVLENACAAAFHLYFGKKEKIVSSAYIQWSKDSEKTKETAHVAVGHFEKVINLLDKYESSANCVKQMQLPINGKNIAANMSPPITPPAISDAVKKHRKQIATLLKEYPAKWILVRNAIKPISQLDQFYFDSEKRNAG